MLVLWRKYPIYPRAHVHMNSKATPRVPLADSRSVSNTPPIEYDKVSLVSPRKIGRITQQLRMALRHLRSS
ncbi:hypothetical protein PGTUg99_030626 [Puccinia graminis f. sp. tritici]|uniref:Uncharacterized protein n=1 Tax=Puccinia graminis f. sp. tritici TaxID=56615 RepID=A0A5B0NYH1_PUCGR|nr:hypothetical protein PGTUg99_030626 [Puccinia graminis f. sp. tritici]